MDTTIMRSPSSCTSGCSFNVTGKCNKSRLKPDSPSSESDTKHLSGKITLYTFDNNCKLPETAKREAPKVIEAATSEPASDDTCQSISVSARIKKGRLRMQRPINQQINSLIKFFILILFCLLTTIVPNNNHFSHCHQLSGSDFFQVNQQHQLANINTNGDWAQRLVRGAAGDWQQQQQQQLGESLFERPLNPVKKQPLLLNQHQQANVIQQESRPARQSFLSDFVSHQSQKLLSNLVPVPEQPASYNQKQQEAFGQNLKYSPTTTMGKLYNFLFPNNPIIPAVQAGAGLTQARLIEPTSNTMQSINGSTGLNRTIGREENSDSTTSGNFEIDPSDSETVESSTEAERQLISLNAPYEARPRASLGIFNGSLVPSSSNLSGHREQYNESESNNNNFYEQPSQLQEQIGSEQEMRAYRAGMSLNNDQDTTGADSDQPGASNFVQSDQNQGYEEPDIRYSSEFGQNGDQHQLRETNSLGQEQQVGENFNTDSSFASNQTASDDNLALVSEFSTTNLTKPDFKSILPIDSSLDADQTATGDLLSNPQPASDESFLTAQLPSQYDAVIRLPPEGYYDDYIQLKPSSPGKSAGQQESLYGEFSMQQVLANHQQQEQAQPEQFVSLGGLTQENSGNGSSLDRHNHQPQNHNYQNQHDYTREFFLNQSPLKQTVSNSDQNIEFLTTTNRQANYTTGRDQPGEFDARKINLLSEPSNSSSETLAATYTRQPQSKNLSLNETVKKSADDDAIQLILADTNPNRRDPANNNERIINYTSERNSSRPLPAGKPARQTFVNKDMNEYAGPEQHQNNFQRARLNASGSSMPLNEEEEEDRRAYNLNGEPSDRNREDDLNYKSDHNNKEGKVEQEEKGREEELEEELEMRRVTASGSADYGRYNTSGRQRMKPEGLTNKTAARNSRSDKRYRDIREPAGRHQVRNGYGKDKARQMNRQPTMRRPQVTQANFGPKDLVLGPPTRTPDVVDSPIESIANLPQKVRRLKQNQPDKNELMNELLTALDRVKVAIYKLQPLTAKMNAIYRKSVTSNTRDIIMDHHKGTYAKRYPPGDYDDSYDRMHPSELIERGQVAARSSRARRMEPSESNPSAVYLPAPRELLESYARNASGGSYDTGISEEFPEASNIVATGVGRHLSDGTVSGLLQLTSLEGASEQPIQKRSNSSEFPANFTSGRNLLLAAHELSRGDDNEDDGSSPLFGYRITIYQSPDGDEEEAEAEAEAEAEVTDRSGRQFSYQVDQPELQKPVEDSATVAPEQDSMLTSESSLSAATLPVNGSSVQNDELDLSESSHGAKKKKMMEEEEEEEMEKGKKKKHQKSGGHEEGREKKGAREKEEEKKKREKKAQSHKKKDEEESKRKKEYKKIKHNKGMTSKEKKSMHRDKHIKAHDRGAAKEKALKERTQIEFFEREQIVDDEFEKGKKSTVKAAWESGHDSKKSHHDLGAGDAMKMDGSHNIKHYATKGHGTEQAASSGKKSNKYEKKANEAKGKKFKGWREKGYKIITETEFIDRGSLHDSAYKKRDKGAAQHQKFKKQEMSSEGHHGSMKEHHKKVHKKEEKKLKEHEKKEMQKKKEEEKKKEKKLEKKEEKGDGEQRKKKKMVRRKKKKQGEGDHEESYEESLLSATIDPSQADLSKFQRSVQPIVVLQSSASSPETSTFRPQINSTFTNQQTLQRLLNSDDHQVPQAIFGLVGPGNSSHSIEGSHHPETMSIGPNSNSATHRRSDNLGAKSVNSSTILDIVDNLTGRQVNKTKIGTYELEDQHTVRLNSSMASPFLKVGNSLTKLFTNQPAAISKQATKTTSTSTTRRPEQVTRQSEVHPESRESSDAAVFLNLLHKHHQRQSKSSDEASYRPRQHYASHNLDLPPAQLMELLQQTTKQNYLDEQQNGNLLAALNGIKQNNNFLSQENPHFGIPQEPIYQPMQVNHFISAPSSQSSSSLFGPEHFGRIDYQDEFSNLNPQAGAHQRAFQLID